MKLYSLPHFVGGIACGFVIYTLVSKFELLGNVCFYVGSFSMSSTCIPPYLYYGAWCAAATLSGYGIFGPIQTKTPPSGGAPPS